MQSREPKTEPITQRIGGSRKPLTGLQEKLDSTEEQLDNEDVKRIPNESSEKIVRDLTGERVDQSIEKVPQVDHSKKEDGHSLSNSSRASKRTSEIRVVPASQRNEAKTQLVNRQHDFNPLQATSSIDIHIPGYELLRMVGRGGMGVVYKAKQLGLDRIVALKMILTGKYASSQDLERFWREASAVASLSHPNIVQVYEVGRHDGYPFYSLEYIDGGTLADVIAQGPLKISDAAQLIMQIADAMQFAHTRQIIHRDLKPSNILIVHDADQSSAPTELLVTPTNASSSGSLGVGIPKITDFGVAKRLDEEEGLTATGVVAGTPQYMSPEQTLAVDKNPPSPASDVYSMGVILYECLTGRVPIDGDNSAEVMFRVARDIPPAPSKYREGIPKDLETICLKCLEKQPRLRYQNGGELADELRRWMQGLPISARPVGKVEQVYRWCNRNRQVASLLGGIIGVLMLGLAVSTYLMLRSNRYAESAELNAAKLGEEVQRAADLARESFENAMRAQVNENRAIENSLVAERAYEKAAERLAETQLARRESDFANQRLQSQMYALKSNMAYGDLKAGLLTSARTILEQMTPKSTSEQDSRNFEWWYLKQLSDPALNRKFLPGSIVHISLMDQGETWRVGAGGEIYLSSVNPALNEIEEIPGGEFDKLATHPGSNRIAVAPRDDDFILICNADDKVIIRRIAIPGLRRTARLRRVSALSFSPDGKRLLIAVVPITNSVEAGHVSVFDLEQNREIRRFTSTDAIINDAMFSADGNRVVFADSAGRWRAWDLTRSVDLVAGQAPEGVGCLVCNRDGSLAALGSFSGKVFIAETASGKIIRTLFGHSGAVSSLAIAEDGKTIASSAGDQSIRTWNIETGENIRTLPGHRGITSSLCFSKAADKLISGSYMGEVNIWDCRRSPDSILESDPRGQSEDVFSMPDGGWLTTAKNGVVKIFNADGHLTRSFAANPNPNALIKEAAVSPDGRMLVVALSGPAEPADHGVWFFDLTNPKQVGAKWGHLPSNVDRMAFVSDGKQVMSVHYDGVIRLTDIATKTQVIALNVETKETILAHSVSRGKEFVVALEHSAIVRRLDSNGKLLWRTNLKEEAKELPIEHVSAMTISPDERILAVSTSDHGIFLLDALNGKTFKSKISGNKESSIKLSGHEGRITRLAFDPTGTRLASVSSDLTVRIWDVPFGNLLLTLRGHNSPGMSLAFSPDGSVLATRSPYEVRLWDGRYARWRDDLRQISRSCRMYCVSPQVAENGIVTVSALLVNESDRYFKSPNWKKIDDRLRAVILLDPPVPGTALPMTLLELNRRRVGDTPFIFFEQIKPGESIPIMMRFETPGWPAGKYRLWFTHSNGPEYSGNFGEMVEFELPAKR